MNNYWLIFFTFGDRKGCKIILARRSKKRSDHQGRFFVFVNNTEIILCTRFVILCNTFGIIQYYCAIISYLARCLLLAAVTNEGIN